MAARLTPASNAARISLAWPGASGRVHLCFAMPLLAGPGRDTRSRSPRRDVLSDDQPAATPRFLHDRLEKAVELTFVDMAR